MHRVQALRIQYAYSKMGLDSENILQQLEQKMRNRVPGNKGTRKRVNTNA